MFHKPNFTQTPNEFFDEIAKTLKEGELRVLLVLMRQTFGWGNKKWDRISLSQLSEKSGMERKSVCRSIKTLVEKKIVVKHKFGELRDQECWYSLVVEDPIEFSNPIDNSKNSYQCPKDTPPQCPKDTPPSVLKTPTKETPTKETKESYLKIAKERSASPPLPFGHFQNQFEGKIRIDEENFQRLVQKFGSSTILDEYAEKLYRYSFSNPKRFKIYTRHDMVLEDWIEKDQKAQKNRTKTFDSDLNDAQKINWQKNQEVVNELIESVPHRAGGLNFYYKAHLLKDKKDPNFSVSGLVDHLTFCRVLDKHLDVDVVAARFPSE